MRLIVKLVASATLLIGPAQAECVAAAPDPAFEQLINLSATSQRDALRKLMTSNIQGGLINSVFYYGSQLRPGLRLLVHDRDLGALAIRLFALIGEPEDLRQIIEKPPQSERAFLSRWAYHVACSSLNPSSEEDWTFLRKCALRQTDDPWAVAGAIQTLRLIASPRARELLVEAQAVNEGRENSIANALEYIDSKPEPLVGKDFAPLGERVVQALGFRGWKGNSAPRCNQKQDEALMDLTFQTSEDLYVYTATFRKADGVWKLRGVRESVQALLVSPAR